MKFHHLLTMLEVNRDQYTAFGEIREKSGVTETKYRYTGQLAQDVLGLDYYESRFYDPYLNRWIQPDPIIPDPEESHSIDRYAYVKNNPIRYNDPSGHDVECAGYNANRCKDNNNDLDEEHEKRKYDIPPVVKFISDEIKKNAQSSEVSKLDSLNHHISVEDKVTALTVWAEKVTYKHDWDHKQTIRDFEKNAGRDPEFQFAGTKEYKFDTWSNIHYGFVGKEAGFTDAELLDGAGAAQYLEDVKKNKDPVADPSVEGLRKYDQPQDRVTIQIGIDLWREYGSDLKPADIIWAIEHASGIETRP
jgi:RHS repeat-associated protein